jgi:hypothetical protein
LLKIGEKDMGHEVTGASITSDGAIAVLGLQDAPLYSLVVLKVETMEIVEQRSLLSIMEYESY